MEDYIITDKRVQNWIVGLVAAVIIMYGLDYSMVNISLPVISKNFNVKLGVVSWLPLIYILVVTSLLLVFGKLGDIKGYKIFFISGISVFLIGTIACALAPTIGLLLAARAFQALGEAMFSPVGLALITALLPANLKGRSLGIIALSQGLGFAIGPAVGGLINTYASWRCIFLVNIPIGILVLFAAIKVLPDRQAKINDASFDILGSALIFIALSTLLFALNSGQRMGWTNPFILSCFGAFAVTFVLFIFQERRSPYPLLDLRLFSNLNFGFANLAVFLAIGTYMGSYFLMPFYLEMVRGFVISRAGLLMMVTPLVMMILSPVAGKLSDIMSPRILCCTAMLIAIATFLIFASFSAHTSLGVIFFSLLLSGVVMGLFMAPNNKLVMASAPADKQGVASGVYKIGLSIGSAFGIILFPVVTLNAIYSMAKLKGLDQEAIRHTPDVMIVGFRAAFLSAAVLCIAALAFSFIAGRRCRSNIEFCDKK